MPRLPSPANSVTSGRSRSRRPLNRDGRARRGWLAPLVLVAGVVVGSACWAERSRARGRRSSLPQRVAAAVPSRIALGDPDLDDLGAMAADWIIRGVMETPLVDLTELEAVYAGAGTIRRGLGDPLTGPARAAPGW